MSEHLAVPRHPDEDLLVGLALGHADPAARQRATDHLALCGACRRSYDELAGAVEAVLPAVPRLSPPPGFEAAVLDRLDAARGGRPEPGGAATPAVRRRTVLLAAAAALTGAVAGAGATAYLRRDGDPVPAWAAPLVTGDGTRVGLVARSYAEDGPALVVDVTGGPAGRSYLCRLRLADGTVRDVATWSLADDRPNSWVVAVPDGSEVAAVELVGGDDVVWASAQL